MPTPPERSDPTLKEFSMPVRVFVTFTTTSPATAEAALNDRIALCQRTEAAAAAAEGCVQYEVFQKLKPNRYVFCESKGIHDKHWHLQREREKGLPPKPPAPRPKPGEATPSGSVEFYEQKLYKNVDGVWMAADLESAVIPCVG